MKETSQTDRRIKIYKFSEEFTINLKEWISTQKNSFLLEPVKKLANPN